MSPAKVFVPKGFWKELEEGEGYPLGVPGFWQVLLTFSFHFLMKKTGKSHLRPRASLIFNSNPSSVPSPLERKAFQSPSP